MKYHLPALMANPGHSRLVYQNPKRRSLRNRRHKPNLCCNFCMLQHLTHQSTFLKISDILLDKQDSPMVLDLFLLWAQIARSLLRKIGA